MNFTRVFKEGSRNVQGHWTNHTSNNIKKFFDEVAEKRNMDPLVAQNWYNVGVKDIWEYHDGRTVLSFYNGSVIKALMDVYPDIGIEHDKFKFMPKRHWKSKQTQRDFFIYLAQKHNFDPLIATNWYNVPLSTIHKEKKANFILNYYNGSALRALIAAFPEINFDAKHFGDKYWLTETNRKEFFDDLANKNGFDYMIPSNWYNITVNDVIQLNGSRVLSAYGGSLFRALSHVYPSLTFNEGMFLIDTETRKRIIEQFATKHKLDVSNKEEWTLVPGSLIDSDKSLSMVLNTCYGGSIMAAVKDLFEHYSIK